MMLRSPRLVLYTGDVYFPKGCLSKVFSALILFFKLWLEVIPVLS